VIDVALVRLVGSGLTLLAEGYGEQLKPGAVERGYELIEFLAGARTGDLDLSGFIASVVGEVWAGWAATGQAIETALPHIESLPALMERYRPRDGVLTGLIVSALTTARQGRAAGDQAAQVAETIITAAKADGALAAQGLDDAILHLFLEKLLARLFADLGVIAQMRPLLQRHLAGAAVVAEPAVATVSGPVEAGGGTRPASGAPGAGDVVAAVAARHGLPEPVLRSLATGNAAVGSDRPLDLSMLEHLAEGVRRLLEVVAAAEPSLLPAARDYATSFRAELARGAFAEAGHMLGLIEDAHVRSAQTDIPAAQALLATAAEMRAARGAIEGLLGEWRKAARHYGAAVRCLQHGDRQRRWRFLSSQGEALAEEASTTGRQAALGEAIAIYATAAGLVSEQDAPLDWARTNAKLGSLLQRLGESEGRPDRFRAAALHFRPAVDVFSQAKATDEWAAAQLGLGKALYGQGIVQGDVVTLGEAAFALRAALAIATPDRMTTEWGEAQRILASTLVRLGQEMGEAAHFAEAARACRTLLAVPNAAGTHYDRDETLILLGDVLLAEAGISPQDAILAEAVGAYRSVLDRHEQVSPALLARAENGLGTALWAVAERTASTDLLNGAANAKLAAVRHFQALGAMDSAARALGEVDAIEQSRARIASAPRADAAA